MLIFFKFKVGKILKIPSLPNSSQKITGYVKLEFYNHFLK